MDFNSPSQNYPACWYCSNSGLLLPLTLHKIEERHPQENEGVESEDRGVNTFPDACAVQQALMLQVQHLQAQLKTAVPGGQEKKRYNYYCNNQTQLPKDYTKDFYNRSAL